MKKQFDFISKLENELFYAGVEEEEIQRIKKSVETKKKHKKGEISKNITDKKKLNGKQKMNYDVRNEKNYKRLMSEIETMKRRVKKDEEKIISIKNEK